MQVAVNSLSLALAASVPQPLRVIISHTTVIINCSSGINLLLFLFLKVNHRPSMW